MAIDPMNVWASMATKTWHERYWMADLDLRHLSLVGELLAANVQSYCCILRDEAGLTAIVDEAVFQRHEMAEISRQAVGPFKMISTDGELPFDVVGFLQPLLLELNRAGVKAGPQCAVHADHLFIYERDVARANKIISQFIARAKHRAS
ncbi:MAG: hypothetical protein MI920_28175 [Kiloniellales bacterium]|nr:hypothetical protein [Kiloniellales bacterium]